MQPSEGLERFLEAQAPVWEAVHAELAAGRKQTHWMWFVFPQLRGLGLSAMAWRYGLASLDEAHAYLAEPVLAARLAEATGLVLGSAETSAHAIFGAPDDMKLRSCMTLFAHAAADGPSSPYQRVLDRFFDGEPDPRTLDLLARPRAG